MTTRRSGRTNTTELTTRVAVGAEVGVGVGSRTITVGDGATTRTVGEGATTVGDGGTTFVLVQAVASAARRTGAASNRQTLGIATSWARLPL
jgi:hypothetical protein